MSRPDRDDALTGLPDAEVMRAALTGPFRRAIRLHPRRGQPTGWGALEVVPWAPRARFHDDGIDPATRLDYHTGLAYPQDAASQVPVLLLDPQPGETVIDACAAPGSKSTQIGLALGDEGLLVCCDASPPRRAVLAEILARQGVACAVVTPMPLDRLAERTPGCADAVLVDAPCSGHEVRSVRQVARMADRQLAILGLAARLVRAGGRLVYSTCTPYRAEDEDVIIAFLATHPGWRIEPARLPGCDGDLADLGGLRLWPHRQRTEPFFACRLRAPGAGETTDGLRGRRPPRTAMPGLPDLPWHVWTSGSLILAGSEAAAACALPSEARGLVLARSGHGDRLDPWGAQALIERGAPTDSIPHAQAIRLWAGEALELAGQARFLRTQAGLPLGEAQRAGDGTTVRLASRLRRSGLA